MAKHIFKPRLRLQTKRCLSFAFKFPLHFKYLCPEKNFLLKQTFRKLNAILFFVCFCLIASSQSITITGTVTDAETGEPIPYVNVYVVGKFHGTSTGIDGTYKLDVRQKTDSIGASAIGYITLKKKISQHQNEKIDFRLHPDNINLNEVVVNAGENPADILFRKMVAAKPANNPANLRTFQYESYTKYELDLDNVTPKDIEKNVLLKGFDFLKEYIDTMSEQGKSILPIFFVEQVSENYIQRDPPKTMERVKGQKMTMIRQGPLLTELISNVNQNFNIYENMVSMMGKNLISPVADYGLTVYKYHINEFDTLYIDGHPHFAMKFKPKRKGDFAFTGKMLVNINNYAVRSIEASIPNDVNIGFVKNFSFIHEFVPVKYKAEQSDSMAMFYAPSRESIKMNIVTNVGNGALMIAKKNKSYRYQVLNEPIDEKKFDPYKVTITEDSAYLRNNVFWDTIRHDKLEKSEAGIYEMVDSLKRTSKFKILKYTLTTIAGGYAKFGPIGVGNVAQIFSRNQVEGWRIRLGVLTNRDFSERVQLNAYGAYGFSDKRFKYGGKAIFIISKKPWHKITVSGRTDIDFMSRHAEEMDQDNVFTLVQKRNVTQRLYNIEEGKIVYDNELHRDLVSFLTIQYRTFQPYFNFSFEQDGADKTKVVTSEAGYTLRWQYKSKFLPGVFDRDAKANAFFAQFRKRSSFPVVWAKYLLGVPKVGNSQFLYHDVSLGFQGNVTLTAKQYFYYNLWFGKIIGTLPFLLLKNPEGNFHHVFNKYLFNNMNLLEFSADQYTSLNFQYFFGGWIADHLPLIKKLKVRGVATSNIFYGNVSGPNRFYNRNNNIGVAYPIPYIEAGFGIENILKFIRIDCIWRVTHRERIQAYNFGVYASLYIKV
jgi:hypothetical protein